MKALVKLWTITEIDLRQRLASRTFKVILICFAAILFVLNGLIWLGFGVLSGEGDGGFIYAFTLGLTMFLGTVLVPVLSGGAINGDRSSGTLATTQITLVTTWQLLLGKVLSAWLLSIALVLVALPFLAVGATLSALHLGTVPATLGMLALEFGVFSALGVAWSSIVRSQVFSVVCTYLTIAVLSVGSLIGFFVGGMLLTTTKDTLVITRDYDASLDDRLVCIEQIQEREYPRFDFVYPLLATNPYVIVVDALPVGDPDDDASWNVLSGQKYAVRGAQIPPSMPDEVDFCRGNGFNTQVTDADLRQTQATWPLGVAMQVGLVGLLLWGGWARTRAPARRLDRGSRVA